MKKLDEMTREEIVALTEEEIQRIINYAYAEAGAPLPTNRPVEPKITPIQPDRTVYSIETIYFADRDEATKVADFMKKMTLVDIRYFNGPSYDKRAVKREGQEISVHSVPVYSEEYYAKIKDTKKTNDDLTAKYKEDLDEYNKTSGIREEIRDEIMEKIHDAQRHQTRIDNARSRFEEYLELADGNRKIALNFLSKAYPYVADYPELMTEFNSEG